MSLRGIHRTFGVCYQTVMEWLGGEKADDLPAFRDTLLPGQRGDVLELDELWSFVGRKTNARWVWVALWRRTRQGVAWTLGDRRLQSACDLRADLPPDYYRRCATRSDFWDAYAAAFPRRTHRCCGQSRGRDLPRRTLVWDAASAGQPPGSQGLFLFQVRREPPRRHPPVHRHAQPPNQTGCNTQLITTRFFGWHLRRSARFCRRSQPVRRGRSSGQRALAGQQSRPACGERDFCQRR